MKQYGMKHFYLIFIITFTNYCYAYVDPGSGGALITAILGFFAAIIYTIKKYFYKIKSFFKKNK
jgi:hypothetical protein